MADPRPGKLSSLLGGGKTEPIEITTPSITASTVTSPLPVTDEAEDVSDNVFAEPRSIEETRIPQAMLVDLALKILYYAGRMAGGQVAQAMRLHFSTVVESALRVLKAQHLVEVVGGSSLNQASYQYSITDKGGERARELLERNRYVGPCPVTLRHYVEAVQHQAHKRFLIAEEDVREALQDLVLAEDVIESIGPAVNSHESIFVYGPPGNGKTSIAKAIGLGLLPGDVMVPYAIYEDGQIIKVFDPETHQTIDSEDDQFVEDNYLDKRWVRCVPPIVITGGELTLSDLDLSWNDANRFYEAPLQVKANGGMLVIDDFGRQQMPPSDLLNRWIVPLEENIDFLTFHTGKKFPIPFENLLVFSTNLEPKSLVDEAFLRRISHKLRIDNPTEEQYQEIFLIVCQARGIEYNEDVFRYLLQKYYVDADRPLRACHPRDLLKQVANYATYRREPLTLSTDLIDRAAHTYFEFL